MTTVTTLTVRDIRPETTQAGTSKLELGRVDMAAQRGRMWRRLRRAHRDPIGRLALVMILTSLLALVTGLLWGWVTPYPLLLAVPNMRKLAGRR